MTDDGDGMEKKVQDEKNHQKYLIQGKNLLQP
jgi:hypothetical protein